MMRLTFVLAILALCNAVGAGSPTGSAVTYQGVLKQGGTPANGTHHLRFQLWDALSGGTQVGGNVDLPSLSVIDGQFTASLDFGTFAFNGEPRWLQVAVVTEGGSTVTSLTPRQPVTPTPYALHALSVDGPSITNLNASNLTTGVVPNAQLSGIYDQPLALTNAANTIDGTFSGNGAGLLFLDASAINSGVMASSFLPNTGAWTLLGTLNVDSNTLVIDPINNRVGIGTASPLSQLHIAGNAAGLRLQDDDNASSFTLLEDTQSTIMRLRKVNEVPGPSVMEVDPMPTDGTSDAIIRVFRATNTTGVKAMRFHAGLNSSVTHAAIGVDGTDSYFQLAGGNFGIGTPTPVAPLHVTKTGPFMVLQDLASNSNQAGYLGFWNSSGTETGWMGFGTPGSPHMSIFNGRAGGNIALLPTSNVGIGTTTPLAKLDVRGDIRMGPTGSLRVTSSTESLRIVRGLINATGSIAHGTGFTVSHPSVGRYIITFSQAFFTTPTVTATGRTPVNARWDNLLPGSVEIILFDGSGLVDYQFCFLAIGPN